MIRIHKPGEPPAVLRDEGRAHTLALCRRLEDGQSRLELDKTIYGAPSVKQALLLAQHDKCCFCESKVSHVSFGDVEHFRPKAACRSSADAPERKPGYYWLAYEWSNLYFACEQCNRRHKRNLFPLEDESARVTSHRDAARLAAERPLYVDPGFDEPEEHIGFRREYAKARPGSRRGTITIEDLGLNREPLSSRRRDHRKLLLTLLRNIRAWLPRSWSCPEQERTLAISHAEHVLASMRDDAEYAAMSRAIVREVIPWREVSPSTSAADLLEQLENDAVGGRLLAIPPD
jgi:uncharacterized protein (TIGR02646 family)